MWRGPSLRPREELCATVHRMPIKRALVLIAGAAALITVVRVAALSGGSSQEAYVQMRNAVQPVLGEGEQLTLAQVVSVLRAAGWPEAAIPEAVDVAGCESSWMPGVVGASGERGLFQIHPVHDHRFDLAGVPLDPLDPVHNAAVALAIWRRSGWEPWTCQPE